MVCETCSHIPLDIFLPLRACGHSYRSGKGWYNNHVLYDSVHGLTALKASASSGCGLCSMVEAALREAEPFWAISEFTGTGDDRLLHPPRNTAYDPLPPWVQLGVFVEGEMIVTDGSRKAGLYWEIESLGSGKHRAPVHEHADCEANFAMARAWLETCSREHTLCVANHEDGFLPTRLIDIGNSPKGAINPRLVITNDVEHNRLPQDTCYLALSHCWGTNRGKTVPKTTTANLTAHLEGIETNTIPKTFSDAMEVVRRLGLRYIWIDSLCIIQDDKKDFEVECSRMYRIYSQAHCTIVASDSPDGDGGCFIPRNSGPALRKVCKSTTYNKHSTYQATSIMDPLIGSSRDGPEQAEVTIYPHFGPWVKGIQNGPVFARGWCLQEREMSPRILHFTRERLLWECRQCVASEDKPQLEPKQDTNRNIASHLSNFRVLDDNDYYTYSKSKNGLVQKSHKWEKLVEAYSKRALSVATDKLPAISGIAASLALRQPDDIYLAGLWRSNLLEGISWFPRKPPEPPILSSSEWPPISVDPGIPSWSWAAYSGPIMFCGQTWFSSSFVRGTDKDGKEGWVKSKLETDIESASVNHDSADAFGRVSEGELVLVGWAAELMLIEDDVIPRSQGTDNQGNAHFSSKCYSRLVDNSGATIYFDNEVDILPETRFLCLQLGTGKDARATCSNADVGLVLLRVSSNDDAYRRVGMFDVSMNRTSWHTIREKRRVRII